MIKFTEYQAFFSSENRDEHLKSGKPRIVYINPHLITALAKSEVGGQGIWPSSWDATHIYTTSGRWTVEGSIETIAEIISTSTR